MELFPLLLLLLLLIPLLLLFQLSSPYSFSSCSPSAFVGNQQQDVASRCVIHIIISYFESLVQIKSRMIQITHEEKRQGLDSVLYNIAFSL